MTKGETECLFLSAHFPCLNFVFFPLFLFLFSLRHHLVLVVPSLSFYIVHPIPTHSPHLSYFPLALPPPFAFLAQTINHSVGNTAIPLQSSNSNAWLLSTVPRFHGLFIPPVSPQPSSFPMFALSTPPRCLLTFVLPTTTISLCKNKKLPSPIHTVHSPVEKEKQQNHTTRLGFLPFFSSLFLVFVPLCFHVLSLTTSSIVPETFTRVDNLPHTRLDSTRLFSPRPLLTLTGFTICHNHTLSLIYTIFVFLVVLTALFCFLLNITHDSSFYFL